MPWNEPGQSGKDNDGKNNDPWGGKSNQSPPDLDKIIGEFIKKLRGLVVAKKNGNTPPKRPSSTKDHHYGFGITALVLVVIWALSGLFIVNPAEQAVLLHFGKYSEVLPPGLHWMARFIDTKYIVDVQKINSFALYGDFLTKSSDQNDMPTQYIKITPKVGASDQSKNLVNVELNVQYRITDPRAYLFNVVNPDETVEQVASGALSDVIGKMKLDDVLTTGRESLSAGVLKITRDVLKNYNSGIDVLSVTLRKVQAPDQVRLAFSDVNRADQDKATYIQQAQAYASKVVPLAQGMAARTMADATAYQQQVVLNAQAQIAKFQAVLKAYLIAPEVTRERMYIEAIQNILHHSTKVLVDSNMGNNMLYLPLDKLLKQEEQQQESSSSNLSDNFRANLPQITQGMNANNSAATLNNVEVKNVSN